MVGKNLSHYKILEELGRGGMGIVYKARDTKLDRDVAIKVLPSVALASKDDRERFYREAKSAAQLHHPNIASVFEIGEAVPSDAPHGTQPSPFIAMEFIEGETLQEYIKKGPLKLTEAVNITTMVAEALRAAHAKDIVHRDIKSANVMLTAEGVAKVLDFGLAKTNASTQLTRQGSTLGTVAYMSPEQARGQEVDGRSDLYSLGTMLYEMVSGRLPFEGEYEQAVVYGILNENPEPLTAVRTGVPMGLEWIVNKMLAKEPRHRYQTAADLVADLETVDLSGSGLSRRSMTAVSSKMVAVPQKAMLPMWVWGAMAALAVVAAGAAWLAKPSPEREVVYLTIDLPGVIQPLLASWSPDGRDLYYVASDSTGSRILQEPGTTHIRRYSMADGRVERIAGTEGAENAVISPDGRWLYFFRVGGSIERMLVSGGSPAPIPNVKAINNRFTVGYDGEVYYTVADFSLMMATAEGVVSRVSPEDEPNYMSGPVIGTTSRRLFWNAAVTPDLARGYFGLTGEGGSPELVRSDFVIRAIARNGYAMMALLGTGLPVLIAPFDERTGQPRSTPVPFERMGGHALSANGHLVYQTGAAAREDEIFLYILGSNDTETSLTAIGGPVREIAVANHRRAVVLVAATDFGEMQDVDGLVVLDLDSMTRTLLTREGNAYDAAWSPDDQYIYFTYRTAESQVIARRLADASGGMEVVVADSFANDNPRLSPDGSLLIYTRNRGGEAWELVGRSVETGESYTLSTDVDTGSNPRFSSDGKYIVYRSGHAVVGPILVQAAEGGAEIEIVPNGATPLWSPDGAYIYYARGRRTVFRRPVSTEPTFRMTGQEELVYGTPDIDHRFGLLPDESVVITHRAPRDRPDGDATRLILNFDLLMEQLAPR